MERKWTTVRDLRRTNRSTVLSRLYLAGPLSRPEISRDTGLSAGTVSNVTAELIEEGLVVEAGLVDSHGGRPRALLRVDPDYGYVVGVDVGETRVRVELFDLAMTRRALVDRQLPSARPRPEAVVSRILTGLTEAISRAGVPEERILGVGIGVFGLVEQGPEVTVHAPTVGWQEVRLESSLRAGTRLPLFIDNGAKALGQAEMWYGAGRGRQHAVIVLVGSGVGAAVITHGQSYRGFTSSAGEWGHTTIVYGGRPCRCGSSGCLEAYVGAEGIIDRYRQARAGRPVPGGDEESQIAALVRARHSSTVAARILEETTGFLGAGLANLINLFNPELIVLGGWTGLVLGAELLPEIRVAAGRHALELPYRQVSIELSQLGADAVAFGAATLPVQDLLLRGGETGAARTAGSVRAARSSHR
ncbi:MAG: sugar kinase [Actinobacteria bacterium 13_1_20CM_3_71_11]|nr:MAG: sugar kinase [Actinobacteria bacterium 13_1_20CM_3_71_11]